MPQPPPEQPYTLPGTTAAFEPGMFPGTPMTAQQASPFIPKLVG